MHRHFRLPALAALFLTGAFSVWAADTPVKGGTLIYLEQQPHTNLYPPAGGFYPNGGILNQITDKLTWQNPKRWRLSRGSPRAGPATPIKPSTPSTCAKGSLSQMAHRWTPPPSPKTSIPMVWEIKPIVCPSRRSSITTSAAK